MLAWILALLSLATGIVWLLDLLWLGPRRRAQLPPDAVDEPNVVIDFARSFFPVILGVFLVRSFLVEPFRIPSGSMIPTLHVGDFILVNKFQYGLRCPIGRCTLIPIGEPKNGDVVVFQYPVDPSQDFIKRVIGIPGDHIHYENKTLTVNGKLAQNTPAGVADDGFSTRAHEDFLGVQHDIDYNPNITGGSPECPFVHPDSDDFDYTVPAGQYFMMGDNRDGSYDSRCWGTVPEANLRGRAFMVWMSFDFDHFRPVFSRIGLHVR